MPTGKLDGSIEARMSMFGFCRRSLLQEYHSLTDEVKVAGSRSGGRVGRGSRSCSVTAVGPQVLVPNAPGAEERVVVPAPAVGSVLNALTWKPIHAPPFCMYCWNAARWPGRRRVVQEHDHLVLGQVAGVEQAPVGGRLPGEAVLRGGLREPDLGLLDEVDVRGVPGAVVEGEHLEARRGGRMVVAMSRPAAAVIAAASEARVDLILGMRCSHG